MANQKDQELHDSPAADVLGFSPSFLDYVPSLDALKRALESKPESESTIHSSDNGVVVNSFGEESKKSILQAIQRKAYYSVLHAFISETSILSNKMTKILEKLMNEWKISHVTHRSFVDKIQKSLGTILQSDVLSASYEKELQIEQEKPLIEPATSSSSSVPVPGTSWGSINPESLVGKWVCLRVPGETEFVEYNIKAYDVKMDKHRLVTSDSNDMEMSDPLSLFDLRKIAPEDIMWEGGERPKFIAPKKRKLLRRALFR